MNQRLMKLAGQEVSAGCHINDVMNILLRLHTLRCVSAGCHINDVMNERARDNEEIAVSAGCHINDVMNELVCT